MRRLIVCTVAMLTLVAGVGPAAQALMIDVFDSSGKKIGFIDVEEHPDGGGVQGWFQSTVGQPEPSLDAAARQNGEHHFNWLQIVVDDSNPAFDPPYIDPPQGGLGGQWADGLPWYWDEQEPDDPLGTPGYDPIYQLGSQLDRSMGGEGLPDQLRYEDFPQDEPGTTVTFVTWLVSLNADGSVHSYHGGFTWTWEAEEDGGGGEGGRELYWGTTYGTATLDPTPLGGDQAWYYHGLLVPEPSTFVLLAVAGLLACAWRRRSVA